jgi:hypothetical protein
MKNLKEKMITIGNNVIPKLVQTAYIGGMYKLWALGDHLQEQAIDKLRNYDFWQGHLSDFASVGMITSIALIPFKNKLAKYIITLAIPTLATGYYLGVSNSHEKDPNKIVDWGIIQFNPGSVPLKGDLTDVGLFYLSSLASLGIKELTERKIKKKK